jgi:hypothetical protein
MPLAIRFVRAWQCETHVVMLLYHPSLRVGHTLPAKRRALPVHKNLRLISCDCVILQATIRQGKVAIQSAIVSEKSGLMHYVVLYWY